MLFLLYSHAYVLSTLMNRNLQGFPHFIFGRIQSRRFDLQLRAGQVKSELKPARGHQKGPLAEVPIRGEDPRTMFSERCYHDNRFLDKTLLQVVRQYYHFQARIAQEGDRL